MLPLAGCWKPHTHTHYTVSTGDFEGGNKIMYKLFGISVVTGHLPEAAPVFKSSMKEEIPLHNRYLQRKSFSMAYIPDYTSKIKNSHTKWKNL